MSGKEEVTIKRLEEEIAKILEGADLKTTSTKKVRIELEKTFADVKSWAKKIDQIVMDHVEKMDDDEDEDIDEISSEEEKPKKKAPAKKETEDDDDDDSEEEKPKKKAAPKKKESEDDDDDDSEEEVKKKKPAAKRPTTRKRRGSAEDNDYKPKKTKTKKAGGGGGGGKSNGYTKAYKLSPALSTLMGEEEMPRHEVVRRVWAMIKEKNLYDPNNKQFAICDDALYTVIGVKKFRTFGMMKYLKNHFIT